MFAHHCVKYVESASPNYFSVFWDCLVYDSVKSENEIALQARALRAMEALLSVKRPYTSGHNISIF